MSDLDLARDLYKTTTAEPAVLEDSETAHLVIHESEVLSSHDVPGLHVDVDKIDDGVDVQLRLDEGAVIKNPVHLCFGVMPEEGLQKIIMNVDLGRNSMVDVLAHCTFPNAVDVRHEMDAEILVREGAHYTYFERHLHGLEGGTKVIPRAKARLEPNARFKTEFELLSGRVGLLDVDYETTCEEGSVLEMTTRVNGSKDDLIKVRETGLLVGERAVGVLNSRVALRDDARAEIYNRLAASAALARGHVDCKEIVLDRSVATATPIVEVRHPKAHVTHEAAIGSVDAKQLETLMSRGLNEDDASDLIISGLLS